MIRANKRRKGGLAAECLEQVGGGIGQCGRVGCITYKMVFFDERF